MRGNPPYSSGIFQYSTGIGIHWNWNIPWNIPLFSSAMRSARFSRPGRQSARRFLLLHWWNIFAYSRNIRKYSIRYSILFIWNIPRKWSSTFGVPLSLEYLVEFKIRNPAFVGSRVFQLFHEQGQSRLSSEFH